LFFGACNNSTTPTTPSATPAPKFTATLLPINEVPPVTNAEASGSGVMTITLNLTKDAAGNITAATADFNGTTTGFPNGTTLTAAHIHPGVAGVNGSPVVNLGLAAGEITFPTGSGTITKTNITMTVDQANSIIANPAAFYFNIHTALNGGGVARGQLVKVQ
jgi:hypothetical protein